MIDWRDPDGRPARATPRALTRWSLAALVVLAAHGAAAWIALTWRTQAASGEAPSAVMIDLAPLAVAPDAPKQDIAPGPPMTEAQSEATPDAPDKAAEKHDATPNPVVKDKAEVTLPPPQPEEIKKPKPREAERKKPPTPKPRAVQTTAPPPSQAQRADRAAAPFASASEAPSAAAAASWRGALMAHLNRYKRFPSGAAGSGVVHVAFTIDRAGTVLSARLTGSSGDPMLDAEAVALPRRASPVPAPPSHLGGASLTLAVPIRFTR